MSDSQDILEVFLSECSPRGITKEFDMGYSIQPKQLFPSETPFSGLSIIKGRAYGRTFRLRSQNECGDNAWRERLGQRWIENNSPIETKHGSPRLKIGFIDCCLESNRQFFARKKAMRSLYIAVALRQKQERAIARNERKKIREQAIAKRREAARAYYVRLHEQSKYGLLGDKVSSLPIGDYVSIESPRNPFEYARYIRAGLRGIKSMLYTRYSVRVESGNIRIYKTGVWTISQWWEAK